MGRLANEARRELEEQESKAVIIPFDWLLVLAWKKVKAWLRRNRLFTRKDRNKNRRRKLPG